MNIDLKNYEIISFDIFDTLIRRKYSQPKDLFKHVGAIFNDDSFAQKRIQAEIDARKCSKEEDITIDEIYAQLPAKYAKYQKAEKELEINNSFADTEMKKVYDTALSLGKKVIATSDMYLDEETISKILRHAGYTNLNKIYISGIYKKTKGSGKLFDTVIKDFKIKPGKILHIGDNFNSDYLSAKNKGLNAFHYKMENLLTQKKFQKFNPQNKDLEKSCFYALLNNYYKNTDNYWQRLGFTYGGPLCYTFITWLYKELEKQDFNDILFISRDAWILKEVFEVLYPKSKFKTHYIYASRQICQNVNKEEYQKYLDKEKIAEDKIALVDTITYEYTAQKFLQQFFTSKITGFYWRLLRKTKEHKAFDFEQNKRIDLYEFMEFMMTAPENPAVNIQDGQITFAPYNDFENKRKNVYLQISKGILDFAKEYKEIYQKDSLSLDKAFVIDFTNNLFKCLDKDDVDNLSSIYHTANHAEGKYLPLLPKDLISFSKWHYPPFLYLQFHFDAIRLKLFNKLTIVKKKSNPKEDKYYVCNILVKRKIHTEEKKEKAIIDMNIINTIQRMNLSTFALHQKTFPPFKNKHLGKEIVILATGVSAKDFKKIPNAIYIGVNRAFEIAQKKDIKLDYIFIQDYSGKTQEYIDALDKYEADTCTKFYGLTNEWIYEPQRTIPEIHAIKAKALRYRTDWMPFADYTPQLAYDLSTQPLGCFGSIVFPALQFALWTHPSKIYLVGCDCTTQGYAFDKKAKNELYPDTLIPTYKQFKLFAKKYYPDIEIISVNPVGLKNIFTDIYN